MRETLVDAGAVRLSVRDHAGGAPPLLCLHGLASNARWWDLVAARLAPRNRVVAVDQRGHGRSDAPDDGYDLPTAVADADAAAAALQLGPLVAVGHSWGASVALGLAAATPSAVLGVICIDGGVADLRSVFGSTWEHAEPAMTPPDLEGVTTERIAAAVAAGPLAEGSDADTALAILLGNFEEIEPGRWRPRLRRERHMAIARALYHLEVPALLREVGVPVLVLLAAAGGPGPDRRAAAKRAGGLLRGGAEVRFLDGGHDLPVQRPAEVAAAITTFVAGLAAR